MLFYPSASLFSRVVSRKAGHESHDEHAHRATSVPWCCYVPCKRCRLHRKPLGHRMLSRASPSWHCSFTSSTSAVSQADGATQSSNAEHSPSSAQGRPVNSRGGSLVGNPESWCLAIASRRRSLRVINWMTNCLTWLRPSSPVPPRYHSELEGLATYSAPLFVPVHPHYSTLQRRQDNHVCPSHSPG